MSITRKRCGELILVLMLVLSLTPFFAFQSASHATEAVTNASTVEEFIEATIPEEPVPTIEVDKETGMVDSEPFDSVFKEDFDEVKDNEQDVIDTIEESGEYVVIGSTEDSYEVAERYGTCRVLVQDEVKSLEGAKKAVSFDDITVLTYGSPSKTEKAYENLADKYGEDKVVPDFPIVLGDQVDAVTNSSVEDSESSGVETSDNELDEESVEQQAHYGQGGVKYYASWGTDYMGMGAVTEYYDKNKNGKEVTVAVIDSGLYTSHNFFKDKIIRGYSVIDEDQTNYDDANGHGSAVAGIIAESTPNSTEILAIKCFDERGRSSFTNLLASIDYAIKEDVDVINMSLGNTLSKQTPVAQVAIKNVLNARFKKAKESGITLVSSSGNDGVDLDEVQEYPAASIHALAVGAISKYRGLSSFSNYGESLDFVAPGQGLRTVDITGPNEYIISDGTSFATPHISAAVALLLSENDKLTNDEIYEKLKDISVDLGDESKDKYYGWGYPKFEDPRADKRCNITVKHTYPYGSIFTINGGNLNSYKTYDGEKLHFAYTLRDPERDEKTGALMYNHIKSISINGDPIDLEKYPKEYDYTAQAGDVVISIVTDRYDPNKSIPTTGIIWPEHRPKPHEPEEPDSYITLEEIKANINVAADKNGTVKINGKSSNLDEIFVGEPITIDYTPDESYLVNSVTVNGEAVDLSKYPSRYKFRVETENVDINVRFEKKPTAKPPTQTVVDLSKAGFIKKVKAQPKNGFEYNGKPITIGAYVKPYYRNNALKKDVALTNYTVKYTKNNQLGTATITFTSKNTKAFKGSIKTTFKIIPRKTPWKKIVMTKNSAQITVKAVNGSPNYQFQIKLNGKGKWKTVNSKKTTYKFTKLKGGKNYQIRVRAYKTVGKQKYYGAWNTITKKTVKKTYKYR